MDPLRESIRAFIVDEYLQDPDQEIDGATPLISGGIVDSFSMVSLKRFIERSYKISIPDHVATAEAFDTVDQIAELIRRIRPDA